MSSASHAKADNTAAVSSAGVWLLLGMQFARWVISIQPRVLTSCPVAAVICARLELSTRLRDDKMFSGVSFEFGRRTCIFFPPNFFPLGFVFLLLNPGAPLAPR